MVVVVDSVEEVEVEDEEGGRADLKESFVNGFFSKHGLSGLELMLLRCMEAQLLMCGIPRLG